MSLYNKALHARPPSLVYIKVHVQETWSPKHPILDLAFKLKLENQFLKLGVIS